MAVSTARNTKGLEMRRIRGSSKERGTSLIEMLIALLVLSVGLVGSMAVVGVAVGSNSRTKKDTTSTALAEMVISRISSVPVGGGVATVQVQDCAGNNLTVATTGASTGSGATLTSTGKIDFNQSYSSVTANYKMQYTVCGVNTGTKTVYDVRWNIQSIGSPAKEEFVVVGARSTDTSGTALQRAASVNLRTIVGNDGN
jgi:Tfp pilus assembly protein PilV